MSEIPESNNQPPATPSYRWPWFVLAAVLLAIILFILWMGPEIRRTRLIQKENSPNAATPLQGTNASQ